MASTPSDPQTADRLLSSRKVADLLGVAMVTLSRWRCEGRGPGYVRLGPCKVGYRASAVQAWLNARTVG